MISGVEVNPYELLGLSQGASSSEAYGQSHFCWQEYFADVHFGLPVSGAQKVVGNIIIVFIQGKAESDEPVNHCAGKAKAAYRSASLRWHPDRNPGSATSEPYETVV